MQLWLRPKEAAPQKTVTESPTVQAHHWALFVSSSIFGLLLTSWLIGISQLHSLQLGSQRLPATLSVTTLEQTIQKEYENYQLPITKSSTTDKFKLDKVGIGVDAKASAVATKKISDSFSSRLLWWRPVEVQVYTHTNVAVFNEFVQKEASVIDTPVNNAVLTVNPDGSVKLSPESAGQGMVLDKPEAAITGAIAQLRVQPLQLKQQVIEPTITSSSLQDSKSRLEQVLQQKITFTIEQKIITADAHDIAAWLILTQNEPEKRYDITIDAGKVGDYINKIVAANVRRPRNQVEVTKSDGTKKILVSGVKGLDVTNKDAATKQVVDTVLDHKTVSVNLNVTLTPFTTSTSSAGEKLVEVDLTNKRMYAYENNTLIKTFLVSAGADATPTVTGKYSIYSKVRIQDMRGSNADGSKYLQPNVEWVNYFYKDYAIHGNYWRPLSYFGSVNSSHGCVGIVNSDAEWFYNWAPIGTQIVIHT